MLHHTSIVRSLACMLSLALVSMTHASVVWLSNGSFTPYGNYRVGGGLHASSHAEAGMYTHPYSWAVNAEDDEDPFHVGGTNIWIPRTLAAVNEVDGTISLPAGHPGFRGKAVARAVRTQDRKLKTMLDIEVSGAVEGRTIADAKANALGKYFFNSATDGIMKIDLKLSGKHSSEAHSWFPGTNSSWLDAKINVYTSTKDFESSPRGVGWGPVYGDAFQSFLGPNRLSVAASTVLTMPVDEPYQTLETSVEFELEAGQIFYVDIEMAGRVDGWYGQVKAGNSLEMSFNAAYAEKVGGADYEPPAVIPEPSMLMLLGFGCVLFAKRH